MPKEKGFPAKIKSALPLSVRQGGDLFHGARRFGGRSPGLCDRGWGLTC